LADRINLIRKKYPKVSPQIIQELSQIDPTGEKGAYLEWLVRRVSDGNIRWPEDQRRTQVALTTYANLKQSPRFLKEHGVNPDINKYTLHDLEDIEDKILGRPLQTERQEGENRNPSAKLIYNQGGYKIIQVGGPGTDLEQASQALCFYANNTRWCTDNDKTNREYLEKGPVYVIFHNGKKIAQADGKRQVMDTKDRDIEMNEKTLPLYKLLVKNGTITKALYYYKYSENVTHRRQPPENEREIATDPRIAFDYLFNFLDGEPWPLAEPAIARDPEIAAKYAVYILKRRWRQAEPAIARDSESAFLYARNIIQGPWPLGELAIASHPTYAAYYASDILHNSWPPGEPAIATVARTSWYYVSKVLHKPWPLGEPAIASHPIYAAHYASDILQQPWPPGEPAIATDAHVSLNYATEVIQGRWPPGEPVMKANTFIWKIYQDFLRKHHAY
jgi:hypothetical protein